MKNQEIKICLKKRLWYSNFLVNLNLDKLNNNANLFSMETPRKPVKKKSATKKAGDAKKSLTPAAAKPKSRFVDDDDEDDFDAPMDDLAAFDHLDGLEEEEDF